MYSTRLETTGDDPIRCRWSAFWRRSTAALLACATAASIASDISGGAPVSQAADSRPVSVVVEADFRARPGMIVTTKSRQVSFAPGCRPTDVDARVLERFPSEGMKEYRPDVATLGISPNYRPGTDIIHSIGLFVTTGHGRSGRVARARMRVEFTVHFECRPGSSGVSLEPPPSSGG